MNPPSPSAFAALRRDQPWKAGRRESGRAALPRRPNQNQPKTTHGRADLPVSPAVPLKNQPKTTGSLPWALRKASGVIFFPD
jgi:hypothetical protein